MEGLSATLAGHRAMTQNLIALEGVEMALQGQRQMAALLDQAVQAGMAAAANPDHLGQVLDTYA